MNDDRRPIFTRDTGLSVGLVAAMLTGVFYIGTWMARVDVRLGALEAAVGTVGHDVWKGRDMKLWAQHLQEANPTLTVPSVE